MFHTSACLDSAELVAGRLKDSRPDQRKKTNERRTSNVQHRTSNKGILSILIAVANRSHTKLERSFTRGRRGNGSALCPLPSALYPLPSNLYPLPSTLCLPRRSSKSEDGSSVLCFLTLETRNSKPETRNPKPETRNSKPATRNSKPATRNPIPDTHKLRLACPTRSTYPKRNIGNNLVVDPYNPSVNPALNHLFRTNRIGDQLTQRQPGILRRFVDK